MKKLFSLLTVLALAVSAVAAEPVFLWRNISAPAPISALGLLSPAANKLPYYTGTTTAALADLSPFSLTLLDDTSASAMRTTLGLVIGTDVLAPSGSGASLTALNATNIGSGTLNAARLPAFTGGDATTSAGSGAITFGTTGVGAGTYRSVTVDTKGRVTAGTNPTTVAGYGITDVYTSTQSDARRNSLAPRQAIEFDGSASASLTNIPAVGTGDFTVGFFVRENADLGQATRIIGTSGIMGDIGIYQGNVFIYSVSGANFTLTTPYTYGQTSHYVFTRSSGTVSAYKNGALTGSQTYATSLNAWTILGGDQGGLNRLVGTLGGLAILNRALSAAEVLALYEQGAPAAADFGGRSQAIVNVARNSDFSAGATDFGNWSTGSSSVSGGKLVCTGFVNDGGPFLGAASAVFNWKRSYDRKISVTFDLSGFSGSGSVAVSFFGGTGAQQNLGAFSSTGTYTVTTTVAAGKTFDFFGFLSYGAGTRDFSLDNIVIKVEGLLCAPKANAPGNGYQLHDQSGNLADITLPTTGVSWSLPDLQPNFVRGTLTWSATHEPKSLLGQRALPPGAVWDSITFLSTASSSGSGLTIGTTASAARWVALDTYAAGVKEVATLANRLPGTAGDTYHDIIIDPDTANISTTFYFEGTYHTSLGTP